MSSLQKRRFDSVITHVYIPDILSLIKSTVLHINPFKCGPRLIDVFILHQIQYSQFN